MFCQFLKFIFRNRVKDVYSRVKFLLKKKVIVFSDEHNPIIAATKVWKKK